MAGVSLEDLEPTIVGIYQISGQSQQSYDKTFARMYKKKTLSPNDVVVLATPMEGIYLTARAMLEPNDPVIVLTLAYDALINLFEHVVGAFQWEEMDVSTRS